jgi:hypothetical protein
LFEIARIAGDEVIGLALGSGDCLHGVFKVTPAERQCLLQPSRGGTALSCPRGRNINDIRVGTKTCPPYPTSLTRVRQCR